jgi:predicted enzyme related to lactoylglutathione lyase
MSSTTSPIGITQIGQIAVYVRDLEKAIAFYRDILGLQFLFKAPPGMAFFDCGGIRILLGLPDPGDREKRSSIIYYKVPDIQAAFRTLKARGVEIMQEPRFIASLKDHDLWLGEFRDVDGNALALMSEVPRG